MDGMRVGTTTPGVGDAAGVSKMDGMRVGTIALGVGDAWTGPWACTSCAMPRPMPIRASPTQNSLSADDL